MLAHWFIQGLENQYYKTATGLWMASLDPGAYTLEVQLILIWRIATYWQIKHWCWTENTLSASGFMGSQSVRIPYLLIDENFHSICIHTYMLPMYILQLIRIHSYLYVHAYVDATFHV